MIVRHGLGFPLVRRGVGGRRAWRCADTCRDAPWVASSSRRQLAQVSVSQDRLKEFIRAELTWFAQRPMIPLRLEKIVHASTPGKVAELVHCELPPLFALRVRHIESLEGWENSPELVRLHEIFSDSFSHLRMAKPDLSGTPSASDLEEYSKVIYEIRRRHIPVTALLGEAMRKMDREDPTEESRFQAWADTFLLSRISTEMLTSHYVGVIDAQPGDPLSMVGVVDTKCDPGQICARAAEQVLKSLCGDSAENSIRIDVQANNCSDTQGQIEFSYIPRYLFYVVQELLRNSARATMEAAKATPARALDTRPITVTVCADQRRVVIRISDQGGGVPFGNGDKIWSYQFSTSGQPYEAYVDGASPLSGWGMGLPLGRLYSQYLGGSLELMNMPGIGVDAYLFLKRISLTDQQGSGSSLEG